MTDPFLILHKVRNAPAFDIAEKLRCPECNGVGGYMVKDFETGEVTDYEGASCDECEGQGFWWIIPTSGHRAYPVDFTPLNHLIESESEAKVLGSVTTYTRPEIPLDWPDHYPTRFSPSTPALDLISALGIKPSVPADFKRRI